MLIFCLCLFSSLTSSALAAADDYAFEPVSAEVNRGEVTLAVRLVHKPTGRPVPDAVITQSRIDMAPDGMATMAAPMTPLPSPQPGVYAFKTDLTMAGRWLLSIAAKVQGEPETVVGKIIFTASLLTFQGGVTVPGYAASKGAIGQLTKALAVEYMERGVRVNAVAPGGVDTPMIGSFEVPEGASKRLMAKLVTPMGFVKPEQVAKVIAFLASDDGDYMTGAIVSVDGGLTV